MGPIGRAARVFAGVLALGGATAQAGTTVESIRKAGVLRCGIDRSEAEFSLSDEHGSRLAFDQDICKAVAVAVLGVDAKVAVKTFPDDQTSLAALRAGSVDLVASVSVDFSHQTAAGIGFSRPVLYDGQALMVLLSSHISSAAGLGGKTVCFLDGTEGADALRAWFLRQRVDFWPFPFQEQGEMEAAFVTGNCAALAGDITRLAATRLALGVEAAKYAILPELLSKDPLAVAYVSSDEDWGRVIRWTLEVLIQAEESGVTAANFEMTNLEKTNLEKTNFEKMQTSQDPAVRRLVGATHELGEPLGLDAMWAAHVVKVVGNYGEIFERDLGSGSALKLPRGRNALWKNGGLMEALPLK